MTGENSATLLRQKTGERLEAIARKSGGTLGYCVIDLATRQEFVFNERVVFPQASAIKIPVLMEVCKQASEGKFKLSDIRRIEQQHKTGGTGVLSELGDGTVQMSLRDLGVMMIVLSDNTATNLLIDLVGMDSVNHTLQSLGLAETRLQRRMMDMGAASRGDENVSTPAEAARVMEILFRGEFVSRSVSDEIISILKITKSSAVSSALPAGTVVAGKPGNISGVTTEWAVVMLKNRPYVVAVMENYGVDQEASGAIKEISKLLHEYFLRLSRATPHGVYLPNHPS